MHIAPASEVLRPFGPDVLRRNLDSFRWGPMRSSASALCLLPVLLTAACAGEDSPPSTETPGADRTTETAVLEAGANLLQDVTPVEQIGIYLVGFHPSREDPSMQMESHHYCNQVNEDFAQCVLFDGNTEDANLHGIEYIISERTFDSLPADEKQYWHPHNYEILSGQLVAPGLPDVAAHELFEGKMNSYGKTWHVWKTGVYEGDNDRLPLGEPHLAWSFNRDGQAKAGMVEARDARMGVDSGEERRERAEMADLARPQHGVDLLMEAFPDAASAPAGVQDAGANRAAGQ